MNCDVLLDIAVSPTETMVEVVTRIRWRLDLTSNAEPVFVIEDGLEVLNQRTMRNVFQTLSKSTTGQGCALLPNKTGLMVLGLAQIAQFLRGLRNASWRRHAKAL